MKLLFSLSFSSDNRPEMAIILYVAQCVPSTVYSCFHAELTLILRRFSTRSISFFGRDIVDLDECHSSCIISSKESPDMKRFFPLILHLFVFGLFLGGVVLSPAMPRVACGSDWPQWRGNARHSASSPENLPDRLVLDWVREYSPREQVWENPLNQDMMTYDRVFEPVVADGKMFIGFNDTDKLVALDAESGKELWRFYADGPIRFAPVVVEGRVLFCSDDGYLYCLDPASGKEHWKFRGAPSSRKGLGNRRLISSWPARGGPVAEDGTVYFASSIWPFMGIFIYALDVESGNVVWIHDDTSADFQKQPHRAPSFAGVAPQGQFALTDELLLVPGGRSLPAALDRDNGELVFFNFGDKGEGGSFVATNDRQAFVHTRRRETLAMNLPGGEVTDFRVNEPVLDGKLLYAAQEKTSGSPACVFGLDDAKKVLWKIEADGTGDLIRAGKRLYAAGDGAITAIELPQGEQPPKIAWKLPVEGKILRLLAADDRLFAVTLDGRILAFAATTPGTRHLPDQKLKGSPDPGAQARAAELLEMTGSPEGYALWYGLDDFELLLAVAENSSLHIVGVDPDAEIVDRYRRKLDALGLYGEKVVLHAADPVAFRAPPYLAELVYLDKDFLEDSVAQESLEDLYRSVRPYGGKLWIPRLSEGAPEFGDLKAVLGNEKIAVREQGVLVSRDGALRGAAPWTHAYGDVANTVKSNDSRVELPLGLLWFGGSSNMDVLPRHGHGPSQQVIGGRLFIQGMNNLQARDVYTGRVLWDRDFPDLGTYQIYFDETYADTPLSTSYNQVHLPGANARGTNYVATKQGVYLALNNKCLVLDPETGKTVREFVLPEPEDSPNAEWGYIGIYGDLLMAGVGFGDYTERGLFDYEPSRKKGLAWSPDHSASLKFIVFDRFTGEKLWELPANLSFLHNGIVAGGGRIYLLDKLPQRVKEQKKRRGLSDSVPSRILAVDAATGNVVWSRGEDVFGSWLSYSRKHDLLVQAGAEAVDRSLDEVGRGLMVLEAGSGKIQWYHRDLEYTGPCMIHGDQLITNTTSYEPSMGAFSLEDGSPITIPNPVTGEPFPWNFTRTYGCNTAVASEHLLTFRSGAAGFYDLKNHSGTGNLGGFKSGCTSNLIVADGVLNAPDYTRTCTCGYQNQTSLALIPMKENELWTYNLFSLPEEGPVKVLRLGINLGAPGDRRENDGTLWINHPPDEGASPRVAVKTDGRIDWFCDHISRVSAGALPWVGASGGEGIEKIEIDLRAVEGLYDVTLLFSEPDRKAEPKERVFEIRVNGKVWAETFDPVAEAEGPRNVVTLERKSFPMKGKLLIELDSRSDRKPVLCGVKLQKAK